MTKISFLVITLIFHFICVTQVFAYDITTNKRSVGFLTPKTKMQISIYDTFSVADNIFTDSPAIINFSFPWIFEYLPNFVIKFINDYSEEIMKDIIDELNPPMLSKKTTLYNKKGILLNYTPSNVFSLSAGLSETTMHVKNRKSNYSSAPMANASFTLRSKKQFPHSVGFEGTIQAEKELNMEKFGNYSIAFNINKTVTPIALSFNSTYQLSNSPHYNNFYKISLSPCIHFNVNHQIVLGSWVEFSYISKIITPEEVSLTDGSAQKEATIVKLIQEDKYISYLYWSVLWKINNTYWLKNQVGTSLLGRNDMSGSMMLSYNF